MILGEYLRVFLLLSPVIVLAMKYTEVIEMTLPDGGLLDAGQKIPHYRSVMDLRWRSYVRFAVKAETSAHLLLSEKPVDTVIYGTDHDYMEIILGGAQNSVPAIRIGTMQGTDGIVNTPNILNSTAFNKFWISWSNGMIQVGQGHEIGHDVFMGRSYPSSTEIKYLALFNRGSGGHWKLYLGKIIHYSGLF